MNYHQVNGFSGETELYETPFADSFSANEQTQEASTAYSGYTSSAAEPESPFQKTYDAGNAAAGLSPLAGEFVQFLGELHDSEFAQHLYEMAAELEDTWNSKISNEVAMGNRLVPFARQQAAAYLDPFMRATEQMIDTVSDHFSRNNLADQSEAELQSFFSELEFDHEGFSPAQEQLFGSLLKKVGSFARKGLALAKKGISAVGNLLPMNFLLGKLKAFIKPLLDKVLQFALNKLPKNLQPYAQTLAKKILNMEAAYESNEGEQEIIAGETLEAVQTELDSHIAGLVFSREAGEAENFALEYELSSQNAENNERYENGGLEVSSIDTAREQFINELKSLQPGESATPAVERFLPVAMMALKPILKPVLALLGRQKIINFMAGFLAKLIEKYVPQNVATPLATSIIDTGLSTIGFETYEMNKPDVAYEAIANTIQETVRDMEELNEETLNDHEAMAMQLMESFETAAANNFPASYIREELHHSQEPGVWVLKPRKGPRQLYKKYSKAFSVVINPQAAKQIKGFRGLPLHHFLRDKLGLDPTKPIRARVHLYEAINGTKLSHIGKNENLPGLSASQPHSWIQLHPLTKEAASLLLHEPGLGKNIPSGYGRKRTHIAPGQRFYFLEINGAKLKMAHVIVHDHRHPGNKAHTSSHPAHSADIRGVINFVKSEIKFFYYFSEEEAKSVVEKLNQQDFAGAAADVRYAVQDVLHGLLLRDVSDKVKIIHESFPELFLENYTGGKGHRAVMGSPKTMLTTLVENLTLHVSGLAHHAILHFLKSRGAEFKQAQAEPQDGVTIVISWQNIPGMQVVKSMFAAIRQNQANGIENVSLPNIGEPEVQAKAGKQFQ